MRLLSEYLRDLVRESSRGWQEFWFTPSDPATLGLIRILAGAMLFYTHLVWSLDLEAFFGRDPWLSAGAVSAFFGSGYTWSYFWWIESPAVLWAVHVAALVVFALLTLGLFSRVVSILAFFIAVSYVNRVPGALFGLDQINALLAMYLMIGPCGAAYSLDRLLQSRRAAKRLPPAAPCTSANLAIRLMQVHMCVIYLFAGLSKLQGQAWWNGLAMWLAAANLEYQSVDLTWMSDWPVLVNLMTHGTILWEVSYCVLIWPRLTRPIVLFFALPIHLGIGIFMGMMTFGLVMLIGNAAFVSPSLVRMMIDRRFGFADTNSREPASPTQRSTKGRAKQPKAATPT